METRLHIIDDIVVNTALCHADAVPDHMTDWPVAPEGVAVGPGWRVTADGYAPPLTYTSRDQAVAAMLGWIDRLTAQVTRKYPEAERHGWPQMEAAAEAFTTLGDDAPAKDLAFLDGMLKAGETRADLAAVILTNATRFRTITAMVRKLRSDTTAALEATEDPAQWEAILDGALAVATAQAEAMGLSLA